MKRAQAGFTLLELLVSVTLLAFLSLGLAAGLRSGTNFWRKAQDKNVDANAMRVAQKTLTDDLSRIYPKYIVESPASARVDFDGTPRRMTFLTTATSTTGHIARDTLEAVSIGKENVLRIGMIPELARAGAPALNMTFAHNLAAAEFSYYGTADGEKTPGWHANWRNQHRLPSLIRIRLAFAGAGVTPWPEMIVAPRIAADAGCTYDALTKFCQGRS